MSQRLRVYIAGPYSEPDPAENVRLALAAADDLLTAGLAPFVPHLSHYWDGLYPHRYEEWLAWCLSWVTACDVLLRLPGTSPGADREAACAAQHRIPVFTTAPALLCWARAAETPH